MCDTNFVLGLTTIGTTRGLVSPVLAGHFPCKEACAGSIPVTSSIRSEPGYNQTADGEAHNLADVRSTRTPGTNPTVRFGQAKTRPDQFSRQAA